MPCYYGCKTEDTWTCETCGEEYCEEQHFHHNDKGYCVECIVCEVERRKTEFVDWTDDWTDD